ncbi:Conserved repeat-containing protein [Methylibium sp. T29]|nr:Conserved repeat-containing protein [Methylibium sp. T29]EWS59606.1 hypothetical protein Y694_02591 [Methylibium sp. T29-B]
MTFIRSRLLHFASLLALACLGLSACGGGVSFFPPSSDNTLSVAVSGNGSVVSSPAGINCGASCSAGFDSATSVTLTATPAAGRVFSGWGGDCAGTASTCTVSMQASRTVTASFNPPPASTFSLNVSVGGGGTVRSQPAGIDCGSACSAAYAVNTSVVLSATPAAGQVFTGWGGACTGAGPSCTVVMSQARSVAATFSAAPAVQRTLSVTLVGSGVVRSQPVGIECGSACSASFGSGASVVLTASPAAGQRFNGWSGACSGAVASCTLAMSANRSVVATFSAATAAPTWQTPQLLESNNDFNVGSRVLTAVSPAGDAVVMWEQSDGTPDGNTRRVYSRRYVAGQGWNAAVVVPGVSTSSSSVALLEGRLLMDGAGTATWLRPNLETRRFTTASGWSSPFVPPARSGGLLSAAVMDATGAIGVVISGQDVYNISLPANANSWLTWARVDASGSLDAKDADVALSADGTALAIWRERNPGDANYSIKAARYAALGGWQPPQTIDTSFDNVSPESPPRVAMDAAGNAIAVWHQGDSLYYNVFSATGGWGTAVQVDTNAVNSNFTAQIGLVMTPSGRAVVTWRSGIFAVKSMQYTPGSGFSAPAVVNSYGADSHLGQDADGNAVIVYVAPDRWPNPTTGSDVYSRRLNWGGAWSDAVPIEPQDGLGADAYAGFNRAGQGVAAWVRGDVAGSSARKSLWVSLLR